MFFGIGLELKDIKASTAFQITEITPSSACKSSNFKQILCLTTGLGWKIGQLSTIISNPVVEDSSFEDFTFDWHSKSAAKVSKKDESSSYVPLTDYLCNKCKLNAHVIGNGERLVNGLLFEQDVHTLKEDISVSSLELRKTGLEPRKIITIKGRTDVVILDDDNVLCRGSVLVAIEVKPGSFNDSFLETGLRKAMVQLIGLNASNPFHSPVVILTNLLQTHLVLFLEATGYFPRLKYSLKISRLAQFNKALSLALKLSQRECFTKFFSGPPTPQTSEMSVENEEEETFENVQITSAGGGGGSAEGEAEI